MQSACIDHRATVLLILLLNGVNSCRSWCGKWACPFDECADCPDVQQKCKHPDMASGTPAKAKLSNFHAQRERHPPPVFMTGMRLPKPSHHGWDANTDGMPNGEAVKVSFDAGTSDYHNFTEFHLGTNLPMYSPYNESINSQIPAIAAAGMRVWRWPVNYTDLICPSMTGHTSNRMSNSGWRSLELLVSDI